VRDVSGFALQLMDQPTSNEVQIAGCRAMMRKPAHDADRFERLWNAEVEPLSGAYCMDP
jgi:acyl-CoA dehydrogenase